MAWSVLVVDDEPSIRETLVDFFDLQGHTARGAATASDARRLAQDHAPDVILLDLHLPDADGHVALESLRADDPECAVIVLTGHADVRTAVALMQQGAADVLEKPAPLETVYAAVERVVAQNRLRQEVAVLRASTQDALTDVPALGPTLAEQIALAARNPDAPVLLQGETGTGKGFVARQIHAQSARAQAPFVAINCASLSPMFFESELFGHERGAFTDARTAKRGLLEVAGAGTVFLDEIADCAVDVQPRLLTVLEERAFRRLGGTTTLFANARVMVATNVPLTEAVAAGRVRADLYYRLQVLTITIPPLRDRSHEIVPLATAFLPRGATLDPSAHAALTSYAWPGNVRELRNTIWRAAILADGTPIVPAHLGLSAPASAPGGRARGGGVASLAELEADAIRNALAATKGNRSHAAQALGIARSTLLEKLKKYDIA